MKHFRATLEGRAFTIFTDHKPLCGAIASSVEKSPRQLRHLSFVAEFCTDIRHVSGEANAVADALSRPAALDDVVEADDHSSLVHEHVVCALALPLCPGLDLHAMAAAQSPAEFCDLERPSSSLKLRSLPLSAPASSGTQTSSSILCDISRDRPRPLVPSSWVDRVFQCIHGISHAGGKATMREVSRRFVWHGLRSDVLHLACQCQDCQASKVHRHVRSPLVQRPVPLEWFSSLHVDLSLIHI